MKDSSDVETEVPPVVIVSQDSVRTLILVNDQLPAAAHEKDHATANVEETKC